MKILMKTFSSVFVSLVALASSACAQDLRQNRSESNSLQSFLETGEVSIGPNQVLVDLLIGANASPGTSITPGTDYSGNGFFLPAGNYGSYLFHLDGPGSSGTTAVTGTISLDEEIVAIIYSNSGMETLLNDSDGIFGAAFLHDKGSPRRLESNDSLTIVDLFTIDYSFRAGNNFIDDMRVITRPIKADITSSKTASIHSATSIDCNVIPGTPDPSMPAAIPGSCVHYEITLENAGPGKASSFMVEDVLDPNLVFQAAAFSGFEATDPSYAEIAPPSGTDCGVTPCTIRVEQAGLNAGDTAQIIIRALIK